MVAEEDDPDLGMLWAQATTTPSPFTPPGAADPGIGLVGILTIGVVAVAGLWLYWLIRKGL